MTILGTLNILLLFTHLAALFTCVGVVFYFLAVWVSGRHRSASLFPFPEVELATQILGAAMTSLWITALPAVLLKSLAPEGYFSSAGITLLGILTLVATMALYMMVLVQDRLTQSERGAIGSGIHVGFRFVAAAYLAVLLTLLLLLMPKDIWPPAYSVLKTNEILPEILMVFALLFGLFLAATTILKDSWFNRSETIG